MPWSADCTINTSESKFSVHTRARPRRARLDFACRSPYPLFENATSERRKIRTPPRVIALPALLRPALKLIFLHNTLVGLAVAFDAVLEFTVPYRKLGHHLVITLRNITIGKNSAEADHASGRKAMMGFLSLVRRPHDGTRSDVVHSQSHLLQSQTCSTNQPSRYRDRIGAVGPLALHSGQGVPVVL